jgi:hypothetical protein
LVGGREAEDGGDGCGGGGAAVFAVVAVDVDGSLAEGVACGACELELAIGVDAAVGDGEVDVSDAALCGELDVWLGAVDADDGFDAEGGEGVEGAVVFGLAAGDEALVEGDEVVETGEVGGSGVGWGGEWERGCRLYGGRRGGEIGGGRGAGGEGCEGGEEEGGAVRCMVHVGSGEE